MYSEDTGLTIYIIQKSDMSALFDEYVLLYGFVSGGSNSKPPISVDPFDMSVLGKSMSLLKVKFKKV